MDKKKYIIEIEEDPHKIRLLKMKNGESELPCMQFVAVSPYKYDEAYQRGVHDTATEIEAIKDEAYNRGRKDAIDEIGCNEKEIATKACQSGLDDGKKMGMELIWEAARKIILPSKRGGFTINEFTECFGSDVSKYDVVEHYSASEAIEKILAYEQKQQIAIGDEVAFYNGEKCVVTVVEDGQVIEVMDKDGFSMKMDDGLRNSMKKTGRHFEELIAILKKMKGE